MKLPDILILSAAVAFLIIGIDQIMKVGFANGYWAIMIALVFFFYFNYRRNRKK
jgi:hypothetical protein